MLYEYDFQGRKPSKAQVIKQVNEGIKQGASLIHISWGENRVDIDYHPNQELWYGNGWIKDIGGDDLAQELNAIRKQAIAEIKQFKKDHFQFVHIGG